MLYDIQQKPKCSYVSPGGLEGEDRNHDPVQTRFRPGSDLDLVLDQPDFRNDNLTNQIREHDRHLLPCTTFLRVPCCSVACVESESTIWIVCILITCIDYWLLTADLRHAGCFLSPFYWNQQNSAPWPRSFKVSLNWSNNQVQVNLWTWPVPHLFQVFLSARSSPDWLTGSSDFYRSQCIEDDIMLNVVISQSARSRWETVLMMSFHLLTLSLKLFF